MHKRSTDEWGTLHFATTFHHLSLPWSSSEVLMASNCHVWDQLYIKMQILQGAAQSRCKVCSGNYLMWSHPFKCGEAFDRFDQRKGGSPLTHVLSWIIEQSVHFNYEQNDCKMTAVTHAWALPMHMQNTCAPFGLQAFHLCISEAQQTIRCLQRRSGLPMSWPVPLFFETYFKTLITVKDIKAFMNNSVQNK